MTGTEKNEDIFFLDQWYKHLKEDENRLCLSDAEDSFSRREVELLSGTICSLLRKMSIGNNDFVLVDMARSSRIFIALLGIAKAGAAFVVVEDEFGRERNRYIKQDIVCSFVIDDDFFAGLDDADYSEGYARTDVHDAAFAVYTSGTTGVPKGVIHEYGNYEMLYRSILDPQTGKLRENRETRFLNAVPFTVVASVMIFALALYSGAAVFTPDYDVIRNTKRLAGYMRENRITETFLVPAMLKMILGDLNPELSLIYTGSEAPHNLEITQGELHNLYLMSESLFVLCRHHMTEPEEITPIGRPNDGIEIRLDEDGEIIVYDPYCRGYVHAEENSSFKDGYFYTGDAAELNEQGEYVLKGRLTDRIKIDGNRVEPMEVETAASLILGGIPCAVKGFTKEGQSCLCLYYESSSGIDKAEFLNRLSEVLPYYMIPGHIVRMDTLPRTGFGKLDRKALEMPKRGQLLRYAAPTDITEKKMCDVFSEILGCRVGINDDLFELGLTSLTAIEAVTALDIEGITSKDIYKYRTAASLSAYYKDTVSGCLTLQEKEAEGRKHEYPLDTMKGYILNIQNSTGFTGLNLSGLIRFSPLTDPDRMRDSINTVTGASSSFRMRLVKNAEGVVVQKYVPEAYRPLSIEYMTEEEAEELRRTFVKPFHLLDEVPYRLRLIRTENALYFFMDFHHIMTDGYGVYAFVEDIEAAYQGKPIRDNCYFAYCYDMRKLEESGIFGRNKSVMDRKDVSGVWGGLIHDGGREIYTVSETMNTGISLTKLKKHLDDMHIGRYVLFGAAAALYLSKANKTNNNRILRMYANRDRNGNQAGMLAFCLITYIRLNREMTIRDIYDEVLKEQNDSITYMYNETRSIAMDIDDLGDVEDSGAWEKTFGSVIPLERPHDSIPGVSSGRNNLNFFNKDGELYLRIEICNSILNKTARTDLLENIAGIMKRLIDGDESVAADYLN